MLSFYNALRYIAGFCEALAFLVPLVVSIPIAMFLRVETSRGHDRVMMVCRFFWLPILLPSWLLFWVCDKLAARLKPVEVK